MPPSTAAISRRARSSRPASSASSRSAAATSCRSTTAATTQGIRIIDVRHEQAAVHAADSWARCNPGKIGVAAITAGPGVTDGVTGIANAWRANSPILVFGGQGPFENLRRGSLQEMDHIGVVRPITKYADAIYQTHRIPEYVELAIRHAVSGIPGPGLPRDPDGRVHGPASTTTRSASRASAPRRRASRPIARRCARRSRCCERAQRPMLMAGHLGQVVARVRRDEPLHPRDAHPVLHQRHGARDDPAGLARVPEPLAARGAEADRLHHARRHAARLPHGASARRSRPTRRSSSSTWTRR